MFSLFKCGLIPNKISRQFFKVRHNFPQAIRCYSCEDQFAKCKVAVINGGGDCLGLAFASLFLKSGARNVVLVDFEKNDAICDLIRKYGPDRVEFYGLDFTNQPLFQKMYKHVKSRHGQLDYVINNLNYVSVDNLMKMICVNNFGLVLGTFLGMNLMKSTCKDLGGTIVNVGNVTGLEPFYPSPVYSGTNFFLMQFTRSLNHSFFFSKTNVRVMAMITGFVQGKVVLPASTDCAISDLGNLNEDAEKLMHCREIKSCLSYEVALDQLLKDGQNGDIWVADGMDITKIGNFDRKDLYCK